MVIKRVIDSQSSRIFGLSNHGLVRRECVVGGLWCGGGYFGLAAAGMGRVWPSGRSIRHSDGSTGIDSSRVVEFRLGLRACRGNGRPPRRQANALQVGLNGAGLGKGGNDLQVTAAVRAQGNVHPKHSPQEVGPRHPVPSLGGRGLSLRTGGRFAGLILGRGNDLRPVGGVGRQYSMIPHQVEAPPKQAGRCRLDKSTGRGVRRSVIVSNLYCTDRGTTLPTPSKGA